MRRGSGEVEEGVRKGSSKVSRYWKGRGLGGGQDRPQERVRRESSSLVMMQICMLVRTYM